MFEIALVVLLVLFLLGGLPAWGWHNYGYTPSFILALVLVMVFAFYLLRRFP